MATACPLNFLPAFFKRQTFVSKACLFLKLQKFLVPVFSLYCLVLNVTADFVSFSATVRYRNKG
ncbi:hypothetical protein Cst_c22790 [Thermoclostridium stercorarium subsp. stercorarium DSM 8532]|jgi:hypothetical protein|uniref:Uncharacterized protein n=3 Tax=Thermoclostridium stercorarium TaxID=1510 RepID=L7VRF3_THES1|nr:hypothetical protein Cst_c22790 [Thermoclostridium stercorarium subsp. stercorarium DSM 8532]ANW99513.1 hypothetical protein CSTERTH_10970 [Thermoclostridium stercorarium subsp. thermolacticum DSM 2910]ANX02140.1 hypothetical protein CSTERLE_11455 [Thermoclostridium stercorarium subsp. leptospartum DSM 9219]